MFFPIRIWVELPNKEGPQGTFLLKLWHLLSCSSWVSSIDSWCLGNSLLCVVEVINANCIIPALFGKCVSESLYEQQTCKTENKCIAPKSNFPLSAHTGGAPPAPRSVRNSNRRGDRLGSKLGRDRGWEGGRGRKGQGSGHLLLHCLPNQHLLPHCLPHCLPPCHCFPTAVTRGWGRNGWI